MSDAHTAEATTWFYEEGGQRKGPIAEEQIVGLIKSSVIARGTSVWRRGMSNWLKVESTELGVHLEQNSPPPLVGDSVNNTLIWVLAFAPLIGYFLEWVVAGAMYGEHGAAVAMANSKFWFITLVLNIILCVLDEKKLKAAGHDTAKLKGWTWLVPVYLYQRAQVTRQNLAYFITWMVCFVLILFA